MIRRAIAGDLDRCATLATALCASFGPDYPKADHAAIVAELGRVLAAGFVLVSENGGALDGLLLLERGRFSFSAEPVILDRGFYAGGSGGELLHAARAIGDRLGLRVYVTRFTRATVLLGRSERL